MVEKKKSIIFNKENGFVLSSFIKEVKRKRILIFIVLLISFLGGVFYSFLKPNLYRSAVTFMPQKTISPKIGGSLGNFAALAGVKLNGSNGESSSLSPTIYPRIFESIDYKLVLGNTEIQMPKGNRIPLKNYFYDQYHSVSILKGIKKWILPRNRNKILYELDSLTTIKKLDSVEYFFVSVIQEYVEIEINEDEGYLQLSSTTEVPEISAQVAENASSILQNVILKIQVERANVQLTYLEKRLEEQYDIYRETQFKLASYKDRNLYSSTQRANAQLSKLQSDYDLALSIYLDLSQQAEAQRLQVKKDSPIFTVLENPIIPKSKVGPNRLFILIFFILIGVFISFFIITGKQFMDYILNN